MTDSTPHPVSPTDRTDPAADAGGGPLPVDVVAGNPPVPITVWRTARRDDDGRAAIPARLAARLIAAYSRPSEVVVDLTAEHTLIAACAAGQRSHHRAVFTDDASLVISPPTMGLATDPRPGASTDDLAPSSVDGSEEGDGLAGFDVEVWFGDDLTDPHLPPTGDAVEAVPDGTPLLDRTSLVAAAWPLHGHEPANRVRLAWLLAASRDLLRPGGCLVLIVTDPAAPHAVPEDFTPIVAAASRAGLGYLQHIVAVSAPVDGDSFTFHATDDELLTLTQSDPQRPAVAHIRVHADLLVFARPLPVDIRARGGHHA